MRINNNMMAINTHRQLGNATKAGAKSMEKLSSGFRINRAGDDAAGLSISEKMRNQIKGLNRASANSQDGISLVQTAEGALDEVHSILKRTRELAIQAGNTGTQQEEDLDAINKEIGELLKEVDAIAEKTEFNGKKILGGMDDEGKYDSSKGFEGKLQIGANKEQNLDVVIGLVKEGSTDEYVGANSDYLGQSKVGGTDDEAAGANDKDITEDSSIKGLQFYEDDVKTDNADTGLGKTRYDAKLGLIDKAISQVSQVRSGLGAVQNRLEHTIKNLDNAGENLQAAESRIRDVDMAKEMMEQTRQNILQQASTAMLAQANTAPQSVLQLLQ